MCPNSIYSWCGIIHLVVVLVALITILIVLVVVLIALVVALIMLIIVLVRKFIGVRATRCFMSTDEVVDRT